MKNIKDEEKDREIRYKNTELAMRTSKEIIIKFIEMGQVTPVNFDPIFERIYKKISDLTDNNL
jgi:hypothetical protein